MPRPGARSLVRARGWGSAGTRLPLSRVDSLDAVARVRAARSAQWSAVRQQTGVHLERLVEPDPEVLVDVRYVAAAAAHGREVVVVHHRDGLRVEDLDVLDRDVGEGEGLAETPESMRVAHAHQVDEERL